MRFQPGEMAVFAVVVFARDMPRKGQQCEVMDVGPFPRGHIFADGRQMPVDGDYLIRFADGSFFAARDYQLRKINPPGEPASLTRRRETQA